MATEADILTVRSNVNEPTDDTFDDEEVAAFIDEGGVDAASATIWIKKAAAYSDMYNQSEAGASAALGDLYKHAKEMADFYGAKIPSTVVKQRAKVHTIVRST